MKESIILPPQEAKNGPSCSHLAELGRPVIWILLPAIVSEILFTFFTFFRRWTQSRDRAAGSDSVELARITYEVIVPVFKFDMYSPGYFLLFIVPVVQVGTTPGPTPGCQCRPQQAAVLNWSIHIWNPVHWHLDRIGQIGTYWYVLVRTGTTRYTEGRTRISP